jgi:hypothetical protein
MGPFLSPDFNLVLFKIFAVTFGSIEWLTVEHSTAFILTLMARPMIPFGLIFLKTR